MIERLKENLEGRERVLPEVLFRNFHGVTKKKIKLKI
jgi:hypothetical protein